MKHLSRSALPDTQPIFLFGAPRSGTTVVFEALARHEDLGWFSNYNARFPRLWWLDFFIRFKQWPIFQKIPYGEKNQFKQGRSLYNCLLPRPNEGYPIWQNLCGTKFINDYLIGQKASPQEIKLVSTAVRRAIWLQHKRRFATKLTGPSRISFLHSIFPEALFINIIRDGRAVVCSQLNVKFWKSGGGYEKPWWKNGFMSNWEDEWDMYGRSPEALAAMQWSRILEVNEEEKRIIRPEQYLLVRYEDFIDEPKTTIRTILSFCGLAQSPDIEDFLNKKEEYKNMNKKYLSFFTPDQIVDLEKIMNPFLKKFGYLK